MGHRHNTCLTSAPAFI